jgi:hypothetical protein
MRATWLRLVFPAILLSGVVAASAVGGQDPPAITDEHLKLSKNNLQQIGLAMHGYHDATGQLPTNISDKAGKPLLSWRVAILPYLGKDEAKLYKEFKLNESWDSETNKKLIAKLPKAYAPVRVKAKEGETFYQVFSGEGAIFGGKNKKVTLVSMVDGTSNTGMIFEAGEPVVWTKPADLPFDEKKALPKLGGLFDGDFHVCRADGSTTMIKKNADEKELKKFIMPADGNVIDFKKLEK